MARCSWLHPERHRSMGLKRCRSQSEVSIARIHNALELHTWHRWKWFEQAAEQWSLQVYPGITCFDCGQFPEWIASYSFPTMTMAGVHRVTCFHSGSSPDYYTAWYERQLSGIEACDPHTDAQIMDSDGSTQPNKFSLIASITPPVRNVARKLTTWLKTESGWAESAMTSNRSGTSRAWTSN